jgi:hypothetical protein
MWNFSLIMSEIEKGIHHLRTLDNELIVDYTPLIGVVTTYNGVYVKIYDRCGEL